MAPNNVQQTEDKLRSVVQNLYSLIVQTTDHRGPVTEEASRREIQSLVSNLRDLNATSAQLDVSVPPDIIDYVQEGRNPDIYTREFVEVVMKNNQLLKGKMQAFAQFRDVFAEHIAVGIPELKPMVKEIVEGTGGLYPRKEG